MQKDSIINEIKCILVEELNVPNIEAFSAQAKLNEDLYLDSVLLMQLLISLELRLGIDIPDSTFTDEVFTSVDSLATFLLAHSKEVQDEAAIAIDSANSSANANETEEFEDIKVHCFVSCLCEMIKADSRVDHRPFYFGVWDADIVVDSQFNINYHSETINHDFFKQWYYQLYGVKVTPWYHDTLSKQHNINTLLQLLDSKTDTQNIMVMLDMFLLPERENKFNQSPFPHYVMLENTDDPDTLFMIDPDFRWQGTQNKAQVFTAIRSESVAGGFLFDSHDIQVSSSQSIHDYFLACFNQLHNPMTDAVRKIIEHHIAHNTPDKLEIALAQLPVLAIRKYAYEHGFAFFLTQLGLFELLNDEFEQWCVVIETLVSTYKKIQFRAMKLSKINRDSSDYQKIYDEILTLLNEQNRREFLIKARVNALFLQWRKQVMSHTEVNTQGKLEGTI